MNMREQAQLIASAMNYPYLEHSITGIEFNSKNVSAVLQNADIKPDDIVIIYYSTHGVKSRYDSNIFPQLDIPKELVSAYKQHKLVLAKKPRFLLTAIEACSGYQDITPQEAFVFEQSDSSLSVESLTTDQVENIRTLFSSACEIIVTAGNPGKNTWATSQGSMFTNCFLRAMTEYINTPAARSQKVNWENLLNQTKQYTYAMTKTTKIKYYPVWEKTDCAQLASQTVVDSSEVEERDVSLNIEVKKTKRLKNRYDVSLTVDNRESTKIDSVVYFLHKTMENPVLTKTNSDEDFFLKMAVWGTFPIKAKVYFSDGTIVDLYKNFDFTDRQNATAL